MITLRRDRRRLLVEHMARFAAVGILGIAWGPVSVEAQPYAYVTNSSTDDVSVIDVATNAVVARVAVGRSPIGAAISLAIPSDGSLTNPPPRATTAKSKLSLPVPNGEPIR